MKLKPFYQITILLLVGVLASMACGLTQSSVKNTPEKPTEQIKTADKPIQYEQKPGDLTPAKTETTANTPGVKATPNAYYEGISFSYDLALAKGITAQTIEASAPAGDDMPYFAVTPKQIQFNFQGYSVAKPSHDPQILIFKVKDYEKSLDDGSGDNPISDTVKKFNQLLKNHPADSSGGLPFLPVWNAAQIFHAQLNYLNFQNGSGIRYLTEFGQAAAPAANDLLFYTYQGMSQDGVYYIVAILPVTHPDLPASYNEYMKGQDFETFNKHFNQYQVDVQKKLNGYKPDSYQPSLDILDAMIKSINIAP